MNLKDWEIETIEALAREALTKRINQGGEIRHEDSWLDVAIRERQSDATSKPKYRAQLQQHAERLGIGTHHPKRDWQPEEYEVASPETSSRWCRIINLVLTVDTKHEWRELHRELISRPLLEHKHDHPAWNFPNEGLDILDLLEREAIHHGLIAIDEPAPEVDTNDLAQRLMAALGGKAA